MRTVAIPLMLSALLVACGEKETHAHGDGWYSDEAVFAPRPGATEEEDYTSRLLKAKKKAWKEQE